MLLSNLEHMQSWDLQTDVNKKQKKKQVALQQWQSLLLGTNEMLKAYHLLLLETNIYTPILKTKTSEMQGWQTKTYAR